MNSPLTTNPGSQASFWNQMNVGTRRVAATALLAAAVSAVQAAETVEESLEPCINGAVSASGNYVSGAEEARARSLVEQSEAAELALEPCINGGVSVNGVFPTQALEDQFYAKVAQAPSIQRDTAPIGELPTDALGQGAFAHTE